MGSSGLALASTDARLSPGIQKPRIKTPGFVALYIGCSADYTLFDVVIVIVQNTVINAGVLARMLYCTKYSLVQGYDTRVHVVLVHIYT